MNAWGTALAAEDLVRGYTFRVTWSEAHLRYAVDCEEWPWMAPLAGDDAERALADARRRTAEAVAFALEAGLPVPEPRRDAASAAGLAARDIGRARRAAVRGVAGGPPTGARRGSLEPMTMADWQQLSDRITHVSPSATLEVDAKAKAMRASGIDVIGFGAGEPNFPTPAAVVEAAAAACRDPRNYKYTPTPGLPELREAIAAKTLRDSGYEVTPDQVVVTNGGKQAVYATLQVLVNPGDEVIIPAPYWTTYPEAVKLAGGVPVEVFAGAERGFEPDLAALEAARTERTKAIFVNTPNNPTGAVWKPETVRAIAEWAIEHHIWIISDEIYEHLVYDGARTTYPGAAVPACRGQLIALNGVAKTYAMPGWRVGWLVAPAEVAKAAAKLQGHMTSNVANVSQRAALAAVAGPLDEVHRMREAFDVRRRAIVEALNAIDGVTCPTPTGAFYAFCSIEGLLGRPIGPEGTVCATSAEFAAAMLDQAHVAAVPGEAFGAPGYLRFSYALADDQLAEGMRRMQAFCAA